MDRHHPRTREPRWQDIVAVKQRRPIGTKPRWQADGDTPIVRTHVNSNSTHNAGVGDRLWHLRNVAHVGEDLKVEVGSRSNRRQQPRCHRLVTRALAADHIGIKGNDRRHRSADAAAAHRALARLVREDRLIAERKSREL